MDLLYLFFVHKVLFSRQHVSNSCAGASILHASYICGWNLYYPFSCPKSSTCDRVLRRKFSAVSFFSQDNAAWETMAMGILFIGYYPRYSGNRRISSIICRSPDILHYWCRIWFAGRITRTGIVYDALQITRQPEKRIWYPSRLLAWTKIYLRFDNTPTSFKLFCLCAVLSSTEKSTE